MIQYSVQSTVHKSLFVSALLLGRCLVWSATVSETDKQP
jgi:hypothetical protein